MNFDDNFVPYELALILKNKGFDEPCVGTYHSDGKLSFGMFQYPNKNSEIDTKEGTYIGDNGAYAPLYQQVIDWFREKHNLEIYTISCIDKPKNKLWNAFVQYPHDDECVDGNELVRVQGKKTSYDALNKAIEEALKLI